MKMMKNCLSLTMTPRIRNLDDDLPKIQQPKKSEQDESAPCDTSISTEMNSRSSGVTVEGHIPPEYKPKSHAERLKAMNE